MNHKKPSLRVRRLGIDTYKEAVIYMRTDCHVCLSEGFEVQTRIRVEFGERRIITTLNVINSNLLEPHTAGLSECAWNALGVEEGDEVTISHANTVRSFGSVRSKIFGNTLSEGEFRDIIGDITAGRYSDIQISSFLTACAAGRMNRSEIVALTRVMANVGENLCWDSEIIVDKHCVGGLPGNRTTPIVVAIVSAFGLTMPKTSSRAITSPAGTADTMEVLAPVELALSDIKAVVGKENGCIAWGEAVSLSPADDILIRVEKALDLDGEGQLIASVLSKKIAAGSTHVLIDIPIGETAKVRTQEAAERLKRQLESVGEELGIKVKAVFSDGSQPVGRGIGPALEARDVLSVLGRDPTAPKDLRERALFLAGKLIEFSPEVVEGKGAALAEEILDSGRALQKFEAICLAQGGRREIPTTPYVHTHKAEFGGVVSAIDNRKIALIAKLAGAPEDKVAGVDLHTPLTTRVEAGTPLFTIHSKAPGKLDYALNCLREDDEVIYIKK